MTRSRMNFTRGASIFLGAALLAAWLAAAAGTRPVVWQAVPATVTSSEVPTGAVAEDIQAQAERLRERVGTAPVPQRPSRNPFEFAGRASNAPTTAPPASRAVSSAELQPVARPALALIGIAEDQTPEGLDRTAVISGMGQLFLVGEDEAVTTRFRVVALEAAAVELRDLSTGKVFRLALK